MKLTVPKPALHLALFLVASTAAGAQAAPSLEPTSVVVTVDGKAILYSEIAISDANTIRHRNFSLPPEKKVKTLAPKELETERHEIESRNLSNLIHRIVLPNLIREYRITASEAEIQKQVKVLLSGQSIEAITTRTRERYALVYEALESVYNGQETEASAYEKYMKSVGPLEVWQAYLASYKTPESRSSLKAASETSVEAMQKAYENSAKGQITEKKLNAKVNEIIAASNPKFKQTLPKAAKSYEGNASEATKYVWTTRREWWRRLYKLRVKLGAEQFKDIYPSL